MQTSQITAKFKGRIFSLGYITGKSYFLHIVYGPYYKGEEMYCAIVRGNGKGECYYRSKQSFESNWKVKK